MSKWLALGVLLALGIFAQGNGVGGVLSAGGALRFRAHRLLSHSHEPAPPQRDQRGGRLAERW